MKITIELPDDHAALMQGIAAFHGQTLERWAAGHLYHNARADLEAAASDFDAVTARLSEDLDRELAAAAAAAEQKGTS